MAQYKIQARFEVIGAITVEAESLTEAIKVAIDAPTSDYEIECVDDTYQLDEDYLKSNYEGCVGEWN